MSRATEGFSATTATVTGRTPPGEAIPGCGPVGSVPRCHVWNRVEAAATRMADTPGSCAACAAAPRRSTSTPRAGEPSCRNGWPSSTRSPSASRARSSSWPPSPGRTTATRAHPCSTRRRSSSASPRGRSAGAGPAFSAGLLGVIDAAAVALVLVGFAAQALFVPPAIRGRGGALPGPDPHPHGHRPGGGGAEHRRPQRGREPARRRARPGGDPPAAPRRRAPTRSSPGTTASGRGCGRRAPSSWLRSSRT